MSDALEAAYAQCQQIARREAGNFYYSFLVLPREKRRGMYALYAFLRRTDDLGDNDQPAEIRRGDLDRWRAALDRALAGTCDTPLFLALHDTVQRFGIPPEYLHAAIDGVLMDVEGRSYETFAELSEYCYRVASVVGLACIHIWGFHHDPAAIEPARACGLAFQLTNILRDLKEDAAAGRVYLPQEDLRRFNYSADDLRACVRDDRFRELMRFEIARAEQLYHEGSLLQRYLEPDGRAALGAMVAIYHGLLNEIRRLDGDVFTRRIALSTWRKWGIAARWLLPRPSWTRASALVGTPER
jgi:phytoene synthase